MSRKADPPVFPGGIHSLWRDERGVILVLAAFSLTVLLAVTGLAVDVGWWYTVQRQNQSAADAAALSAGYEVIVGRTNVITQLTPAANHAAGRNGYTGSSPAVTYPYGGAQKVEVILQQPQGTWFASLTGLSSVGITTRAVAKVEELPAACVLATNPTASNTINVVGSAVIEAPNCTLVSNSNSESAFHLQGAATIDAATLITPGEVDYTGDAYTLNVDYPAQTGGATTIDPYNLQDECDLGPSPTSQCLRHANLVHGMPTSLCDLTLKVGTLLPGGCVLSGTSIMNGDTLGAGTRISGGLTVKNGTVNLSPGIYWITDGNLTLDSGTGAHLTCTACTNGGPGVTIIFTTGQLTGGTVGTLVLASNSTLTLNAPSSGSATGFNNSGMVLIQDSWNLPTGTTINTPSAVNANSTQTLSGLIYFPKSALEFQGTPSASGPQCLLVVANTLLLRGNPGLSTAGCQCSPGAVAGTCLGLNTLPKPKMVALVE